jgi:hypothetical protein
MYYIKYQDKELPLKFNYSVIRALNEKYGIDTTQENFAEWSKLYDSQEKLVFEMLKAGHKIEGIAFNLTLEDVVSIFDECYADCMTVYTKCAIDFVTPKNSDILKKK